MLVSKKSYASRVWSIENYAKLIEKLVNIYNAKIIFFGSKDDVTIVNRIKSKTKVKIYNSAGLTNLTQAIALIKKCKLFITHDCGLMHIAYIANIPIISIFGPTDPRRWAPLNKHSIYIWKDKVKCEKCAIYGKFPYCDKHISTDSVKPEDVLVYVKKILKKR